MCVSPQSYELEVALKYSKNGAFVSTEYIVK